MKNRNEIDFYLGIDAGKHTGFAVWDLRKKSLVEVKTMLIHRAIELVRSYHILHQSRIHVIVEDARQANHYRNSKEDAARLKGAGSIMRDCIIWEDMLKDYGIPFTMRRPNKSITKFSDETFVRITGWIGRTSNHARDAAFLVYGR